MYMNKFLLFVGILTVLSGCGGGNKSGNWYDMYEQPATTTPQDVQNMYLYSTSLYGTDEDDHSANIAVLLPMNGSAKSTGNNIKTSIETAFLRKTSPNIKVSFYDLSGDKIQRDIIIQNVLNEQPDIVIGPLFAEDTKTIHDLKPADLPVLSFTSDASVIGDGVMTLNLIPTQSIETIINQMQSDKIKNIIILAPNDKSGILMASVAKQASDLYNISVKGLLYYTPGNSDSIKDTCMRASLYNARNAANTRAREILSDILTKETISDTTRNSLNNQLEKISRTETTGKLPYDAILLLGNGEDSKALMSFLRYYGVNNREIAFYGTTLWQNSDVASDLTMSGAKYAALPEISEDFINLYNMVADKNPDYLAAFGYDAANLALGMSFSKKSEPAYLLDPSGYMGSTGIFRLQPSGESERALRIMVLNGSGTPNELKSAPKNFLKPLYNIHTTNLYSIPEQPISTTGINPGDYINIPESLRKKAAYKTKAIGANYVTETKENTSDIETIQIYEDSEKETISNPDFEPVKLESISRKYIDSVEITE